MNRIFISYRRELDAHIAGRIYDRLATQFGRGHVFKDVDSIPVGSDFRDALLEVLGDCGSVLVVIGASWLEVRDPKSGRRRLEIEGDFVRLEIEAALGRRCQVIPVLVGDTPMPAKEALPPGIRQLAFRQAARVRPDPDFNRDMDRLIQVLERPAASEARGPDGTRGGPDAGGPAEGESAGATRGTSAGEGRRPGPTTDASRFERLWRELGPAGAVAHLETSLRDADERSLRSLLQFLRRRKVAAAIPLLFHLLAHRSEAVRRRAKALVQAFGWPEIAATGVAVARRSDDAAGSARVGFLLEGLAAIEADADVVALLERLVVELAGDLRTRAIFLLERKRLGMQCEEIAALFRGKASPYRIEKPLGQGLLTAAYLATHEMTGRPVVVRVLRPEFVAQPRALAQFLDLSKRSFGYVHQGLVPFRDVQAIGEHRIYYTVRDYVDGVTLRAVLADGKRFEPEQSLEILRQALEALTPVHREGACHGGVKSSNLFLCNGERVRVVLGDPSPPLVGSVDLDRLSYDYRYAPPELFRAGAGLDPRSDFYAMGCLAYELLCGAPPIVSDNAIELAARHGRESIPPPSRRGCPLGPSGDAWVLRLLAPMPAQRFADLEEALAALSALQTGLRPHPGPDPDPAVGPHPVTILGRDALARYEAPESILRLTGSPGTGWPSFSGTNPPPNESPDPVLDTRIVPVTHRGADPAGPGGPGPVAPGLALGQDFGRYRIERVLGRGGMGSVYLAHDLELGRLVALKVPDLGHYSPDLLRRFRREARVAASVSHPNLCPIYDVGEVEGVVFLTMPYLEGETLASVSKQGPLPPRQAAEIVRTAALALQVAHDGGIVHRDLKPSNVMMSSDRGPIVMDFGIARQATPDESSATMTGQVLGTPSYMAPEQVMGDVRAVSPATDVFSLGVILYQLLSGQLPFRGQSIAEVMYRITSSEPPALSSLVPGVDRRLERICRRAMAKRVEDRYRSMRDLAGELSDYLDGAPAPPAGAGWWTRLADRLRGR